MNMYKKGLMVRPSFYKVVLSAMEDNQSAVILELLQSEGWYAIASQKQHFEKSIVWDIILDACIQNRFAMAEDLLREFPILKGSQRLWEWLASYCFSNGSPDFFVWLRAKKMDNLGDAFPVTDADVCTAIAARNTTLLHFLLKDAVYGVNPEAVAVELLCVEDAVLALQYWDAMCHLDWVKVASEAATRLAYKSFKERCEGLVYLQAKSQQQRLLDDSGLFSISTRTRL